MSLHKLTAGSGYDYLTRQVAVQDITEKGHTGLASYYTERGETPGVWVGSGCASIDPNLPDSVVTQEQMQALFGAGLNPIGPALVRELGPDAPEELKDAARRLPPPSSRSTRPDPASHHSPGHPVPLPDGRTGQS